MRSKNCTVRSSLAEKSYLLYYFGEPNTAPVHSNGKRVTDYAKLAPNAEKLHPGISSSIITELTDCNAALSQQRKKRQIPATLALVEALETYSHISSHPFHKANKQGIITLDILHSKDTVIFYYPLGQILVTLSGHFKKVTSLKFVGHKESEIPGSKSTYILRIEP
ncbi:unnamed protein product [Vicia faba]|uniref:Pre-mRNA-processing factor 19 n=1 Tax=Vicia faba TaxID=3906 RepID=A0AAV0ZCA8_VICFA|nr:unnamed protein product [Vicia faba]